MPLVTTYRKARGRPLAWQTLKPREKELASTYEIAARNQASFTRAFRRAVHDMGEEFSPLISAALRDQYSVNSALRAIPGEDDEVWQRFGRSMGRAYGKVIAESGQDVERLLTRFKKDIGVDPVADEDIRFYIEWATGQLIKLISDSQKAAIQKLVSAGIDAGDNPRIIARRVREFIGLLPRQLDAVARRKALLEAQGVTGAGLSKAVDRYASQLLARRAENIARTEMIDAEAFGRLTKWRSAARQDFFEAEQVERVWIAAMGDPDPNNPCEICVGLDGETADLNGTYPGGYDRPPAHPSCRCSEAIRVVS